MRARSDRKSANGKEWYGKTREHRSLYIIQQPHTQWKYTTFSTSTTGVSVYLRACNDGVNNSPTAILTINLPNQPNNNFYSETKHVLTVTRNWSIRNESYLFWYKEKKTRCCRVNLFAPHHRSYHFVSCVLGERVWVEQTKIQSVVNKCVCESARISFHSPLTQTNSFHLETTNVSATEHIL